MTIASDPISQEVALTSATVATVTWPSRATTLLFVNITAGDTWITINGGTPTVGGANEWLLPSGDGQQLTVSVAPVPEPEMQLTYTGPVIKAITATGGNIYIQAD